MSSFSREAKLAGALAVDAIIATGYIHAPFLLITRAAVIYFISQHAPLAIACGFFVQQLPVSVICFVLYWWLQSQWFQLRRFVEALRFNAAATTASAQNILHEWYGATMPEYRTKTKHILVFGSTGTGKSTLINNITGSNLNASNRVIGVTLSSTEVSTSHNDMDYRIIDTAGLNEGDNGTVTHRDALVNLVRLLNTIEGGLNLMIMVTRDKIVRTTLENYRLFVEIMTSNKVPTIIVQTHLDDETNPDDWVAENQYVFSDQNLIAKKVVGTAFPQYQPWRTQSDLWATQTSQQSTERVWTAIESCASKTPISYLTDKVGFVVALRRVWNVFARRLSKDLLLVSHEMVTVIKDAANVSESDAKVIAHEAEACRG